MKKIFASALLLGFSSSAMGAPASNDAWAPEAGGLSFHRVAAGISFDPRTSRDCKSVEYPIRTQGEGGVGWIDTRPKVAYTEWHSDGKRVGPSPDGKLWVCEDTNSNTTALFGPPQQFDRLEDLPPAAKKMFTGEGFQDNIRLLGRYPWPMVKKILAGELRDCYRAAARIAKAEDKKLHPEEWALQDVHDSGINTGYGRNGYKVKEQARLEGANVVHPIQVIHERFSIHKLDDYSVRLNAGTCALVSITPGTEAIVGWSRDGRRRASLADFIGDPSRIPTPGAAEREVDKRKVPLPETPGAGAKALSQGSAPARALIATFGLERVRAAFIEIDKIQVIRDASREAYIAFLDSRQGTLHQYIGSTCSRFQDEKHDERLIEADKDDSEPNLDLELSRKCMASMLEIYPE